jgi:hypothetical protein
MNKFLSKKDAKSNFGINKNSTIHSLSKSDSAKDKQCLICVHSQAFMVFEIEQHIVEIRFPLKETIIYNQQRVLENEV